MNIVEKIIGLGLMIAGVAICAINYFIVKAIATIGTWLAELTNAAAGVDTWITIIICVLLSTVLASVAVVGILVVKFGTVVFRD